MSAVPESSYHSAASLSSEDSRFIAEQESLIAERGAEVDRAYREGRLEEMAREVPSIREQLAPFFNESPFID